MNTHSVLIQVPETLYARLKQRAEKANKALEAEVIDVLASAVTPADALPGDLEETLAALALLDDDALWRAARSRLAEELAARAEELHLKRQREGLTAGEQEELQGLIGRVERVLLIRAEAAGLLKQRGFDVSEPPAQG